MARSIQFVMQSVNWLKSWDFLRVCGSNAFHIAPSPHYSSIDTIHTRRINSFAIFILIWIISSFFTTADVFLMPKSQVMAKKKQKTNEQKIVLMRFFVIGWLLQAYLHHFNLNSAIYYWFCASCCIYWILERILNNQNQREEKKINIKTGISTNIFR